MNKGVKSPTQITPNNLCRHSPLKEVEPQTLPLECERHFVTRFRGYSVGRAVRESCSAGQKPGRHNLSGVIRIKVNRGKLCQYRGLLICCGENTSSLQSSAPKPIAMRKTSDKPSWAAVYKIPDRYFSKLSRTSKTRKVLRNCHTSESLGRHED